MMQTAKFNYILAREEDTEVGDKILNLWNDIEELHREARIHRKILKVKKLLLKKLMDENPNVVICGDTIEYDDFTGSVY